MTLWVSVRPEIVRQTRVMNWDENGVVALEDGETAQSRLQPLPYHQQLRAFLKQHQAKIWQWFASEDFCQIDAEAVRLELLKSTYRLQRQDHGELYSLAERALERLGMTVPLTLYQSQAGNQLNAFVAYVPNRDLAGGAPEKHVHVVFEGGTLDLLTAEETVALLGHELAHFLLWDSWDHEFFIARHQIIALAEDPRAESSYEETARLDRIYTEIFADRGSLLACGDLRVSVAMLVKMVTGLKDVSADSYLRQADEVFDHGHHGTEGITHPEVYIRARALRLWAESEGEAESLDETESEAETEIARMIHGPPKLDGLDVLGQAHWATLTRRLLQIFLCPPWFQTETVLAHARHFFDDFQPAAVEGRDEELFSELQLEDPGLRDYMCYLLVDFIALARELEEAPVIAGFALAERLGVGDRLKEVLAKELRIPKRQLDLLRSEAKRQAEQP